MKAGSYFLWNILLALVWSAATGSFTEGNLVAGFLVGYMILAFSQSAIGESRYFSKSRQVFSFFGFFVWEVILSNFRMAYDVLNPARTRPGIIGVSLEPQSDTEISVLATLLTLTPGTLSVDVTPDRKTMYVHAMSVDNRDALERKIKQDFERRVLELLR
jgi:multicomponent Na+:H+ antiporter subunit E